MTINKKYYCFFTIFLFSYTAWAAVPVVNLYRVEKRDYSLEPQSQHFTISAYDKALLVNPSILSYTQLNPLKPEAVYTIRPYPNTSFLPSISKWMIIADINAQPGYFMQKSSIKAENTEAAANGISQVETFVPAHWISLTNARGQYIIEPVNYAFIVYAKDISRSIELFNAATNKAGFTSIASQNHTDGYHVFIGDTLVGQLEKEGLGLTFSNGDFRRQNDHFRTFGAYPLKINRQQAYVFVASVSEESGIESEQAQLSLEKLQLVFDKLKQQNTFGYHTNYGHHFVSFANAKNNLAVALIESGYPTYYSTLGNVVNTLGESTEDHDGNIYITEIKHQ